MKSFWLKAQPLSELAVTFGSHRASALAKSLKSFALTLTRRRHQCCYMCLQASAFKARNKQARHVIDYLLANPAANAVSQIFSLSLSLSPLYFSFIHLHLSHFLSFSVRYIAMSPNFDSVFTELCVITDQASSRRWHISHCAFVYTYPAA